MLLLVWFQVTPALGILCVILIILTVDEPPRGQAEGGTHLHSTSWSQDMKYLTKKQVYLYSTYTVFSLMVAPPLQQNKMYVCCTLRQCFFCFF